VALAGLPAKQIMPSFNILSGNNIYHLIPFLSNSLLDGRGASLPWMQGAPDPLTTVAWQTWIEISDKDAISMGLKMGDIVRVITNNGEIEAVAYPHPAIPPGTVAIPLGQGHTSQVQFSQNKGANLISILAPEKESETGAFAWGATRVRLELEGSQKRITKFEGPARSIQEPHERIVRVVRE